MGTDGSRNVRNDICDPDRMLTPGRSGPRSRRRATGRCTRSSAGPASAPARGSPGVVSPACAGGRAGGHGRSGRAGGSIGLTLLGAQGDRAGWLSRVGTAARLSRTARSPAAPTTSAGRQLAQVPADLGQGHPVVSGQDGRAVGRLLPPRIRRRLVARRRLRRRRWTGGRPVGRGPAVGFGGRVQSLPARGRSASSITAVVDLRWPPSRAVVSGSGREAAPARQAPARLGLAVRGGFGGGFGTWCRSGRAAAGAARRLGPPRRCGPGSRRRARRLRVLVEFGPFRALLPAGRRPAAPSSSSPRVARVVISCCTFIDSRMALPTRATGIAGIPPAATAPASMPVARMPAATRTGRGSVMAMAPACPIAGRTVRRPCRSASIPGPGVARLRLGHDLRYRPTPSAPAKRVLLASPRGYCAGVDRAVVTVEKALEQYGAPVYVRKQIVHNKHVVANLRGPRCDLRRGDRRGPRGCAGGVLRARGVAGGARAGGAAPAAGDRRHLPAGHQGAQGGHAVRRRGLRHPADRAPRSRGGRGHPGRGARVDPGDQRRSPTSTP